MRGELLEAERVHSIVAAFFIVFNYFGGGGMCESSYIGALEYELALRGHKVDREVMVPVYYKDRLVARQRLDMVVDDRVIVECKATDRLPISARPQPIGYLRGNPLPSRPAASFWSTPTVLSLRRLQKQTTKGMTITRHRSDSFAND